MPWNKAGWISHGWTVCYTLSFVFLFYVIVLIVVDSRFRTRMREAELQTYEGHAPGSLASENLARAAEFLRLSLRVEARSFPMEELTKTKAWSELQNTLSEYARDLEYTEAQYERLEAQNELLEAQIELWRQRDSTQSDWFMRLCMASAVGMVVFEQLVRRSRKMDSKKLN